MPHLQHHQPVSKRCQIPRKFTCPAEHPHRLQELLPQPKLQSPHPRAKGAWGSTPRTSAGTRDKVLATLSEASQAGSSSPRSPPLPALLSSPLPPPPAGLRSSPVPPRLPPAGSVTCSARRPPHGRGERCRCRPRRQPRMLRSARLLNGGWGKFGAAASAGSTAEDGDDDYDDEDDDEEEDEDDEERRQETASHSSKQRAGAFIPSCPRPWSPPPLPLGGSGTEPPVPRGGPRRPPRSAPLRSAPPRPDPPRSIRSDPIRSDPRGFPRPCAGGRARSAPIRSSPSRRRLPRQLSGLP